MTTLRTQALALLLITDPAQKATQTLAINLNDLAGAQDQLQEPPGIPGRPQVPALVPVNQLKKRAVHTTEGRAALIHALAHIEFNAINLALDLCWRFTGMPDEFYRQWMKVAQEEAYHFGLLRDHLKSMGHDYGDFPAHNALWEMAEKTKGELLARIALVPRTLEARGLDATPAIQAKLIAAGDARAGEILEIILRDEIGHVAVGNYWYGVLCKQGDLEPIATYTQLAQNYKAPRQCGPFNLEARRAAGFSEHELANLGLA